MTHRGSRNAGSSPATQATNGRGRAIRRALITTVSCAVAAVLVALLTQAAPAESPPQPSLELEEIYILRSIRERQKPTTDGCASAKTGFEPLSTDAERFFSFWSLRSRPEDGRVLDAKSARVAELRACLGPTSDRARQRFHAEIQLGSLSFRGNGECLAIALDSPERGLFPVRCQLTLSGLPAPYVGGLLTTNTLASQAPFGGDTDPPGYTQASIATIRLWKAR